MELVPSSSDFVPCPSCGAPMVATALQCPSCGQALASQRQQQDSPLSDVEVELPLEVADPFVSPAVEAVTRVAADLATGNLAGISELGQNVGSTLQGFTQAAADQLAQVDLSPVAEAVGQAAPAVAEAVGGAIQGAGEAAANAIGEIIGNIGN